MELSSRILSQKYSGVAEIINIIQNKVKYIIILNIIVGKVNKN